MSVTEQAVSRALAVLAGSCTGLGRAEPAVWAAVLNVAPLTASGPRGERVPICDEHGVPIPLNPTDVEVVSAAMALAAVNARFIQAGTLAVAIQKTREGDAATRAALVQADAQRHGPLIPDGLGGDVMAELAWRAAATTAIAAGASRQEAEAHAWRLIGRTPPQIEAVTGGPAGPEAAREAIRSLATNHAIESETRP